MDALYEKMGLESPCADALSIFSMVKYKSLSYTFDSAIWMTKLWRLGEF
jgi:hypothetical protein